MTTTNDVMRLKSTAVGELGPTIEGLSDQISQLEGIANKEGETEAVAKAASGAKRQSELDEAQFERATRGMDLSDRQTKSANRRLGLGRSLARARATGAERRGFTDRAKVAQQVGGSFADALLGQRISGETALASADAAKRAAEEQRRANKKAAKTSLIGTIIGVGLSFLSSEKAKDDLGHEKNLLARLKKVRVNRWNYKGGKREHIGPFAEEFNREFGTGTDTPEGISVIDMLGVTLGAVKELDAKVDAHG